MPAFIAISNTKHGNCQFYPIHSKSKWIIWQS